MKLIKYKEFIYFEIFREHLDYKNSNIYKNNKTMSYFLNEDLAFKFFNTNLKNISELYIVENQNFPVFNFLNNYLKKYNNFNELSKISIITQKRILKEIDLLNLGHSIVKNNLFITIMPNGTIQTNYFIDYSILDFLYKLYRYLFDDNSNIYFEDCLTSSINKDNNDDIKIQKIIERINNFYDISNNILFNKNIFDMWFKPLEQQIVNNFFERTYPLKKQKKELIFNITDKAKIYIFQSLKTMIIRSFVIILLKNNVISCEVESSMFNLFKSEKNIRFDIINTVESNRYSLEEFISQHNIEDKSFNIIY